MPTALELLDALDLPWISSEAISHARSALLTIQEEATDALSAILALREAYDRSQHRISVGRYHVLCRVCAAMLRSMDHKGDLPWQDIVHAPDLTFVLRVLDGAGFSYGHSASEEAMARELGKPLMTTLSERFGSQEELFAHLRRYRTDVHSRESDAWDPELYATAQASVSNAETPDQMRRGLRTLGLPGDCFRTSHWLRTLGISQRKSMQHVLKAVRAVIINDPRFAHGKDFAGWMEGDSLAVKAVPQEVLWQTDQTGVLCRLGQQLGFFRRDDPAIAIVAASMEQYPYHTMSSDQYRLIQNGRRAKEHPWARLCSAIDPRNRPIVALKRATDQSTLAVTRKFADFLWIHDGLTVMERVDWCTSPDDVRRLLHILGIEEKHWKDWQWMQHGALQPVNMGSFERNLADLAFAFDRRFQGYDRFVSWMDGAADDRTVIMQRVRSMKTVNEFLLLCSQELCLANNQWKSQYWLTEQSMLPEKQGGVGKDLSALVEAVEEHPDLEAFRLGDVRTFREFVRAIEGRITGSEDAREVIMEYAERLGMSIDQLLRRKNAKLIASHPPLREAWEFLCVHASTDAPGHR